MKILGKWATHAPFVFVVLSLALLWATGSLHFGAAPDAAAGEEAGHEEHDDHAEEDGHEGHDHGEFVAARASLDELETLRCEHDVPTMECGGCRFEIGVVRLEEDLADTLVTPAVVEKRAGGRTVSLTGEVRLDRTRVVAVPTTAPGRIVEIAVDLGERVRAGDRLAVVHSGEFGEAKAAFLNAHHAAEVAEEERRRQASVTEALDDLVARLAREKDGDGEIELPDGLVGEWKSRLVGAAAELRAARLNHGREHRLAERGISSKADHEAADRELAATQAGYAALVEEVKLSLGIETLRAENAAKQARTDLLAARQRLRVLGMDEAAIAAVADAEPGEDFGRLVIRAPRDGVVTALDGAVGRYADAGEPLFTVADLSSVWVWCDLYEADLAAVAAPVAEGRELAADVSVRAFPGESFAGELDVIDSAMDEHTRTVRARVRVRNPEGKLRPGMFARIAVRVPSGGEVRVVPRTAVLTDEGTAFVFRRWRDGYWVRRDVEVRGSYGDLVEVEGDLPEGAAVAAGGAFMLKSDVLREKMGAG